jgi:hypothetical protein
MFALEMPTHTWLGPACAGKMQQQHQQRLPRNEDQHVAAAAAGVLEEAAMDLELEPLGFVSSGVLPLGNGVPPSIVLPCLVLCFTSV